MDESTRTRLIRAVDYWAKHHPTPDQPSLMSLGRGPLSPSQIANALHEGTPEGELLLEVLGNAIEQTSLDEVLADFEGRKAATAQAHGD